MKQFITLCLMCISVMSFAQKNKEKLTVNFYGIDFSNVNVIAAKEPAEKFIDAFKKINQLLISEASKYNVGKLTNSNTANTSIELSNKRVAELNSIKFIGGVTKKINIDEVIKAYGGNNENGLVIIAQELNKAKNYGTFIYVFFNGKTNEIIKQVTVRGKTKGSGLRNFWAGALYNSMRDYNKVAKKLEKAK